MATTTAKPATTAAKAASTSTAKPLTPAVTPRPAKTFVRIYRKPAPPPQGQPPAPAALLTTLPLPIPPGASLTGDALLKAAQAAAATFGNVPTRNVLTHYLADGTGGFIAYLPYKS